jgi:hypothetical protein
MSLVSAAREQTLAALGGLSDDRSAATAAAEAMVPLQSAANWLGTVQRVLDRATRSAPEVPPPVTDPGQVTPGRDEVGWTGEAAAVIALAESAVPYASSGIAEVDYWLRVLRREGTGKVGRALAELGFPDEQLVARADPASPGAMESIDVVRTTAGDFARRRQATAVTTTDVLFAILTRYGRTATQALYERGIERRELLDQIAGPVRVS